MNVTEREALVIAGALANEGMRLSTELQGLTGEFKKTFDDMNQEDQQLAHGICNLLDDTKDIMDKFRRRFPMVQEFCMKLESQYREKGQSKTVN